MSNSCKTPIPQSVISNLIERHITSYYKIGDLYEFLTQNNWRAAKVPIYISHLLDVQVDFGYDDYVSVCQYGNSLSRNQRSVLIPGTIGRYARPYLFRLTMTHICAGQKISLSYDKHGWDPITTKATMFSFFQSFFVNTCIKAVKRVDIEELMG